MACEAHSNCARLRKRDMKHRFSIIMASLKADYSPIPTCVGLRLSDKRKLAFAARLYSERSCTCSELMTTEPSVHI